MATRPPRPNRPSAADDVRTGTSVEAWKRSVNENLLYGLGRVPVVATRNDKYLAVAMSVRDRLLKRWIHSGETYYRNEARTVCYLSAEFLLGPHLGITLLNLGGYDELEQALREEGEDLDVIIDQEEEPGLGNGGLGRLAACYLDSLATLRIPSIGYGIRYEFGIFDQVIRDGWQAEITDKWLQYGNPWEVPRPEIAFPVKFGGHTEHYQDQAGRNSVRWVAGREVKGVAYDTPIVGYRVNNANLLRLWKSEAAESFDLGAFNEGDYWGAVEAKVRSENITKVLYPNDVQLRGKVLRLEQQHFFVSCSLQDMIRIFLQRDSDLSRLHEKYATQLNDTHPAIGVAELMRLLVDEHGLEWDVAWNTTRKMFGYTNHTLLPEALEKWPVSLFGELLPRHLEIVYEINRRFLDEVRERFPGDEERIRRMSLIDEDGGRFVRMAHLACVGSHAINGVAALHTELLKRDVLGDFNDLWPEKFSNKTNGVTPRRFVALINRGLKKLLDEAVGDGWLSDLELLRGIEPLASDAAFRETWRRVKRQNKEALCREIAQKTGVVADPASLFDVQVKRIHEYKRQHLNLLHVVTLYRRLKRGGAAGVAPRTVIFGGKSAPGYRMAKLIIRAIHGVAEVVNGDPELRDRLKVVFLPDYNVKNCQRIFPAAELSEQISTAGKEASGTGNMKFGLNGAVTIGTLDGANVEILDAVGEDNFFLFGLTASQVAEKLRNGYVPWRYYEEDVELKDALDQLASGAFSRGDASLFQPLVDSLLNHDPFLVLADYRAYLDCQGEVSRAYQDEERWTRMSILNTARMGRFSSDRAIRDYCRDIWHVEPVDVDLDAHLLGSR